MSAPPRGAPPRRLRLPAIVALGLVPLVGLVSASGGSPGAVAAARAQVHTLELFYTAPMLVRAGEPVRIPVDVVCATASGTACAATVTASAPDASGRMADVTAPVSAGLGFDLTAPTTRALGAAGSASVPFQLRASAGGRTVFLSQSARSPGPLRVYVVRDLPVVDLPAIDLGRTVDGEEVLFLPWGAGSERAGLRPGNESPTVGPASFDVAPDGSIVLLDTMQERLAWFRDGRLVRAVPVTSGLLGAVAAGTGGEAYLAARSPGARWLGEVRRIDPDGTVSAVATGLPGLPTDVRASAAGVSVRLLPVDAWVGVAGAVAGTTSMGRPTPEGQLLVSATQDRVRLGTVVGGVVRGAVELRSGLRMGAVALAEPDGAGGYRAVLHLTYEVPRVGDQFVVVHVLADRTVRAFAVPAADYADAGVSSRFRIGPDGALYRMRSTPDGVRILRYGLEEGSA